MIAEPKTISLPFRFDDRGRVAFTTDRGRQVADRISMIISTAPGERVFRASFGAFIRNMIFDTSFVVPERIRDAIAGAVRQWEPNVTIESIEVLNEDETIDLTVKYSIREALTKMTYVASISVGGSVLEVNLVG